MKKILPIASAILISAASPLTAMANDSGVYAGLNYNFMDISYDTNSSSSTFADSYHAVNPYMGYSFNKFLAVEAGGFITTTEDKKILNGAATTEVSFRGFHADVVGSMPVTKRLDLLASAGYVYTDSDITVKAGNTATSNSDGHGYRLGLGAEFDVTSNIAVRTMGYYQGMGLEGIDHAKVASVGLKYKF